MRLTPHQTSTIKTQAREIFGPGIQVHLFGSRTDDTARGGDIDLLITASEPIADAYEKSLRLNARLQMALGEQKIDIIIKDATTAETPFLQQAAGTAIRL